MRGFTSDYNRHHLHVVVVAGLNKPVAVNRQVAGSNPARGANLFLPLNRAQPRILFIPNLKRNYEKSVGMLLS
jgi:hypothetical protein